MSASLIVVGITGEAGSGKDTAANFLVSHHGYHRIALADGARSAFNDLSGPTWEFHKSLTPEFGIRRALQTLGTEAREETGDRYLWVNLLMAKIIYARFWHPQQKHKFVIPDVRFPFEADVLSGMVAGLGGHFECWRIVRLDLKPIAESNHSSEAEIAGVEARLTIINSCSVARLADHVSQSAVGLERRLRWTPK